MKVCIVSSAIREVNPYLYGGLEKIVHDLAISLVRYKEIDKVSVICTKLSRLLEHHPKLELITTVEPSETPIRNWIELEEEAYRIYEPYLAEYDWILDHSWFGFPYIYALKNEKVKVIHTFHGALPWSTNPPLRVEELHYVCASRVQAMIYENVLHVPCKVIHHGIDTRDYEFKPEKERFYLYLNRIMREKGAYEFTELARMNPKEEFIMAGEDLFVSDLNFVELIKKRCRSNLTYLGSVPHAKKVELLRNAKALVGLPIFPYIEIFGLYATEAMACGTPVLALRNGGLIDQVVHGETGFLFDTISELDTAIKNDIVSMIEPKNCYKRVKKFFTKEVMSLNYKRYINALS